MCGGEGGSAPGRINIWRNNVLLMSNPANSKYIHNQIQDYFERNAPSAANPFLTWNAHKAIMRGVMLKLGA